MRAERWLPVLVTWALLLGAAPVAGAAAQPLPLSGPAIAYGVQHTTGHLTRTAQGLPADAYPDRTDASGQWLHTSATSWTSGYYPALLWAAHQATGDPTWRTRAERAQLALEAVKDLTVTHDLGLMLLPLLADHRLTGDPAARAVLLTAADTLGRRFSPVVGAIKSYDVPSDPDDFPVIIDNTMNLELLLWAARHGGDPAHRQRALQHALTTARDHVDDDGVVWQNVRYDATTGAVLRRSDRAWARGQAWAVHGFTDVYAGTGDARLLATARAASARFLAAVPEDGVPPFHLDEPTEPRDSSATAIAAAGLLRLSLVDPDTRQAARWRAGGERLLASLLAPDYAADVATSEAAVLHGAYALRPGAVDLGLVWADYYRLSALLTSRQLPPRGARLPVRSSAVAVTDGLPSTAWPARTGGAPLVLDLRATRRVGALRLGWQGRTSVRFAVQASVDGVSWREVFRGRSAGDDSRPEAYDLGRASARYLRVVVQEAAPGSAVREAHVHAPEALTAAARVAVLDTPQRALGRGARAGPTSQVLDGRGRPVAGARVELWTRSAGPDWTRSAVARTGGDGRTRWPVPLSSGQLQVRVPATSTAVPAVSAAVDVSVVPARSAAGAAWRTGASVRTTAPGDAATRSRSGRRYPAARRGRAAL